MARNAHQVRINEINILLKRLDALRSSLIHTADGTQIYGIRRAIQVLGERKREVKVEVR